MRNSLYDNIIDEFLQHDINQEVSNLTEDIYSLVTSPMEEALSLTTSTTESVAPNILMAEAEKAAKEEKECKRVVWFKLNKTSIFFFPSKHHLRVESFRP